MVFGAVEIALTARAECQPHRSFVIGLETRSICLDYLDRQASSSILQNQGVGKRAGRLGVASLKNARLRLP